MNQITRILCQKYTDLTDDEISYLEEYNKTLQALANAAQADVFIDCRSCTGKSAIVVGEAKPQTVASSYSKPLLGMPMNWLDEPAMERSFRLGVPTIGRKAVSVPENGRVVQTVEPIFFEGRLIAVLIYEKKASLAPEVISSVPDGDRSFQAGTVNGWPRSLMRLCCWWTPEIWFARATVRPGNFIGGWAMSAIFWECLRPTSCWMWKAQRRMEAGGRSPPATVSCATVRWSWSGTTSAMRWSFKISPNSGGRRRRPGSRPWPSGSSAIG